MQELVINDYKILSAPTNEFHVQLKVEDNWVDAKVNSLDLLRAAQIPFKYIVNGLVVLEFHPFQVR